MSYAPILEFTNQAGQSISYIQYVQSNIGTNFLPVAQGETSVPVIIRVYNNLGLASNIASAFNVSVTTYDGVGSSSHTAGQSVTGQQWIRIFETGFGENSTPPGQYTQWSGSDTAIGGSQVYYAEVGSDGTYSGMIRAGTDRDSVGFIEFETYAQLPQVVGTYTYTFAISLAYEWIS